MKPSYTKDRDALLTRLSRIEGQVRGVKRMVDEETYCIDVLTQINAIKAAIDQVGFLLLEDHIQGCVTTAVRQGISQRSLSWSRLSNALPRPESYGIRADADSGAHRRQPSDGLLHVLGHAMAADLRVRPVGRRPGIRLPLGHAARDGRSPAEDARHRLDLGRRLVVLLLRRQR